MTRTLGLLAVTGAILACAPAARAGEPRPLSARVVRSGVDLAAAVDGRWGAITHFTPAFRAGYTFGRDQVGLAIGGEFRLFEAFSFKTPHVRSRVTETRVYARVVVRDGLFAMYAGGAVGATQSPSRTAFAAGTETYAAGALQVGAALHVGPRVGAEVGAELEATAFDGSQRISARVGAFARF
ncbi:MAG: hypothetical protein K8W52_45795 [Deltaproteobacteria bacterium]|nr:hypothetical protein [Deltaproteobacteria bacterium]